MYSIIYSIVAEKQIKKLDPFLQRKIISTIERIRIRPEKFIKKLVASPFYSLRSGDFRIILDIKKKKLIILVIKIGHRRNVYK